VFLVQHAATEPNSEIPIQFMPLNFLIPQFIREQKHFLS
jgi:hypothetical protein